MAMAMMTIWTIKCVGTSGLVIGIPMRVSYIETIAGAPKNTPKIVPNIHPKVPMKIGARTYPGMIDFLLIPRVRKTAISFA